MTPSRMAAEKPQESGPDLGRARSRRSHPPALLAVVTRTIRDERLVAPGELVLCACSGGPDSTALLHALASLQKALGFRIAAHGVDHGLRPDAAAELELAGALAARLGVPFEVTRVDLAPGSNLQARARHARLGALRDAAVRAGASAIATGHTADDRAETVLLRLLRGAGPRGLAVLPASAPLPASSPQAASFPAPATGEPNSATRSLAPVPGELRLVRPLLRARRADVVAHLERHGLAFATDPSNADPRFARVRVRREVIPLLEELAPRIVESLCALADMLGSDDASPDPLARLGRAQRLAIDRARRLGRGSLKLRVRGGEELDVTFPGGRIVLTEEL